LFATGVVYTSGKFAAGTVDTGGNLPPVSTTLAKLIFTFSGCMSPLHQHQVCSFVVILHIKESGRLYNGIGLGKYINSCGFLTYLFE
jgi:hypothetical protein